MCELIFPNPKIHKYSDGSTKDVTNLCTITPAEGKAFDPETDTDVTFSYAGLTTSTYLTEIYLTGIEVTTNPSKTAYKHGERISYSGMVVTASYSDGSLSVVTSSCSFTPKDNKNFDAETDSYVDIKYSKGQNDVNCTLTLTPIIPTSLQVTNLPDKTAYSTGEAIDYTGVVVTASYSNNSTNDVTGKCTFTPAEGKTFVPENDTDVTITYTEGQIELSCNFTLTEMVEGTMTLRVDTMPDKTRYKQGDTLDYTGAVIKAVYADGTEHVVTNYCDFSPANGSTVTGADTEVTVSCAPPITPYVFDHYIGYVYYGTWYYNKSAETYLDIYEVKAAHKYLLTLDGNVGSRFRVMFSNSDISQSTVDVNGESIVNIDEPDAYVNTTYTPSSNGYIVVSKDNIGKSGVKTYLYDADTVNAPKKE